MKSIEKKAVGLGVSLDVVVKRKKSLPCPCWELNLSHPTHSPVTILMGGAFGDLNHNSVYEK